MTLRSTVSSAELTATAIRILCREIGLANTARFLSQISAGAGDYTAERHEQFGSLTMDDIIAKIRIRRAIRTPYPVEKAE